MRRFAVLFAVLLSGPLGADEPRNAGVPARWRGGVPAAAPGSAGVDACGPLLRRFPSVAVDSEARFESADAIVGDRVVAGIRARLPVRSSLDVVYPRAFDDPIVVALGAQRVVLRPLGAAPAFAIESGGKVLYERAYPSTDAIEIPHAARSEELLLLHDAAAPRVFEWEIVETEGVAGIVLEDGEVRFLPEPRTEAPRKRFTKPAPAIRIERPWVIDANGTRSESAARWSLERDARVVRLTLDARGLAYPLVVDPSFSDTGSLVNGRSGHTATLLPNGKVLIAGGYSATWLSSAELYDPVTGTFTATGSMTTARVNPAATLLRNGKVLISGGENGSGNLSSAELYDPATGTFAATGNLVVSADRHTATLLSSGKVLIVNGSNAQLYDPSTGTFSLTGNPVSTRFDHAAALLPNGKVLVAGGFYFNPLTTAELYDPSTGTFSSTGPLNAARSHFTATLLANGKVLVAGGTQINGAGTIASAELYDPALGTFTTTGSLATARDTHSATLLPNGKVLVAAGFGTSNVLASAELYDPVAGTFSATDSLDDARWNHTATLLPNGKVLMAAGNSALTSAELYDPDDGAFAATGSMATMREKHTSTLLPNGRILIAGGTSGAGNALTSCELYDPSTGIFSATGSLGTGRHSHTATLLANGKVLIVGGFGPNTVSVAELYDPSSGTFSNATGSLAISEHTATLLPNGKVLVRSGTTASLFDPATGTFSPTTGAVVIDRKQHTATLLANGRVLIAGGYGPPSFVRLATAELYDPNAGTFAATAGNMSRADAHHATLLANGKVLITHTNTSAELFDPGTGTFSATGNMTTTHGQEHSATVLHNGKVLIAGGSDGPGGLTAAELYDPALGTFTATGSLAGARENQTATLLLTGRVLVAGGDNSGLLTSAELYDPGQGIADARRPVISGAPSTQAQPGTMTLTGTQFLGDSEGGSGSNPSSPANYPVLHLQRVDNDQRLVLGSTSWSGTSHTSLTIAGLPSGHYRVTLVTNGIAAVQKLVSFDAPGALPQMTISDVAVTEGNAGTTSATFTVTLSAPGAPMTVNYATADGTAAASSATVSNATAIAIPSSGNATPYPSTINVSGLPGAVTKVTVTLNDFSHTFPRDTDVLLVGPEGQKVVLMSDAGSSADVTAVDITLDDAASNFLPSSQFPSGTYKPTNIADNDGADNYATPAPAGPYASALSAFNGTAPNGTWSLYAVDDVAGDSGTFAGGWSLTITTSSADYIAASGTLELPMGTTSRTVTIAVTGDTNFEGTETFFVNLTNATGATITDAQGVGTIFNDDVAPGPPANVIASATGTTSVLVTWSAATGAESYRVYRGTRSGGVITYSLVGSPATLSFTDATAAAGVSYLYKVRSFALSESSDSGVDLATTVIFTDPTLTSGTGVKLAHFTELLTAVNAVRTLGGLGAMAFTAPAPANGVTVRRQHVLDLRSGLDAGRSALTLPALSYTDPSITAGVTPIQALHMTELRNGVK